MNYFDYYKILGIKYPSSAEEIKRAYYEHAKKEHPDVGGDKERMQLINEAYETLSDPEAKASYDRWYLRYTQQNNTSSSQTQNTSKKYNQKQYITIHLITLDNNVVHSNINANVLKFDYKKYLDEYGELYFREIRQGSKIITAIMYKEEWILLYYKNQPDNNNQKEKSYNKHKIIFTTVAIMSGLILIAYLSNPDGNITPTLNEEIPSIAEETPTPYLPPEQPTPTNGHIFKQPTQECIAPFTIETQAQDSNDYYIYLQHCDGNSSEYDISFFVQGGNTVEIEVPLGTYKIYYCSGSKWYGTEYKFGENTQYSTSDDLLEFYHDNEYVYGNTITLYPVSYGNFETEYIDEYEFPG